MKEYTGEEQQFFGENYLQFPKLRQLWLDSHGAKILPESLDWLETSFQKYMAEWAPTYTYPNSGNVILEWVMYPREAFLEIDFTTKTAVWHFTILPPNYWTETHKIDLSNEEGWKLISELCKKHIR